MSIQYEAAVIGEVRATQLSAAPGVGGIVLRFTANWMLHPKRNTDMFTVFGTYFLVSISTGSPPETRLLGQAVPETAWCDECREGTPSERPLIYYLGMAADQLLALEDVRKGHGLSFHIDVRGNAVGPRGIRQIYETLKLSVPVSDWLEVLRQANSADVLLVGVPLLPASQTKAAEAAFCLIRRAHEFLLRGEYDAAVGECRRALESLWSGLEVADEARNARRSLGAATGERRSMSKLDRQLALGEAVINFANPAHHVDHRGAPEIFSRLDAALAVAAAAALVSSLATLEDRRE